MAQSMTCKECWNRMRLEKIDKESYAHTWIYHFICDYCGETHRVHIEKPSL